MRREDIDSVIDSQSPSFFLLNWQTPLFQLPGNLIFSVMPQLFWLLLSLADLNDLVLEILHEGAIRHEFPSLLQGTSSYADSSCLEIQKETARGVNSITQKKQQSNNNKRRISSTKRRSTSALKISQSYASIMSCHYSTLAIGSNYMGSTVLVMAHIKPTSLLRLRLFFSITIVSTLLSSQLLCNNQHPL